MDINNAEKLSEIIKNSSESFKNCYSIFDDFFHPNIINGAIKDGHVKIIESLADEISNSIRNGEVDVEKLAILCNYKNIIREYKNCKSVVDIASNMFTNESKPQNVDEDWFTFFFDKVKLTSNESMQHIWAQVLAGEVNNPGVFQKSLLNILSIMNSDLAKLFCNISRFCLMDFNDYKTVHPFIFISTNVEAYANSGITREQLLQLEHIGLIQCDFKDEFIFLDKHDFRIGNYKISVSGDKNNKNRIKVGNVIFTRDGIDLYSIIDKEFKEYRSDILEFTFSRLKSRNCQIAFNDKYV